MPRKPRQFSSTGIYHITLRSVNQQLIFEEEADYKKFLFILSDCGSMYRVTVYAYCLMSNHIHLLLFCPPENLSHFFRSFGSRFVRWYNNKYIRVGPLFQDRFHSYPVENPAYYLNTLAYIHHNPVKAGICRYPSEYPWSSFNTFFGQKNPLIDATFSFHVAGSKDQLQKFLVTHDNVEEGDLQFQDYDVPPSRSGMTDEYALEVYKTLTNNASLNEVKSLPRVKRNELIRLLYQNGLSQNQIARFLGISRITVQRICKI